MTTPQSADVKLDELGADVHATAVAFQQLETDQNAFIKRLEKTSTAAFNFTISTLLTLVGKISSVDEPLLLPYRMNYPGSVVGLEGTAEEKLLVASLVQAEAFAIQKLCLSAESTLRHVESTLDAKLDNAMQLSSAGIREGMGRIGALEYELRVQRAELQTQTEETRNSITACIEKIEKLEVELEKLEGEIEERQGRTGAVEENPIEPAGHSLLQLFGLISFDEARRAQPSEPTLSELVIREQTIQSEIENIEAQLNELFNTVLTARLEKNTRLQALERELGALLGKIMSLQTDAQAPVKQLFESKSIVSNATVGLGRLNARIEGANYSETRQQLLHTCDVIFAGVTGSFNCLAKESFGLIVAHKICSFQGSFAYANDCEPAVMNMIETIKYRKLIKSIAKKAWPGKTTQSILEANSVTLKQGCHAAEQVFQDAERLMDDVAEEVVYEDERMTTIFGEKVWKVVNEFQDLRTEMNERLAATKVALVDCENEKKQNEIEKKRLEVFLKEAGEKAVKLEAEKKKIRMGTASSTALAVTGAILTPFLPIAGVPMLCVGSGLALGSEIQASDCTNGLHEARWSKDHYQSRIDDLRAKANRMRHTTLVQLERDERLFGILNTDLEKLKTTAGDLQSQANRQVRQVTEAKRAVSAAVEDRWVERPSWGARARIPANEGGVG
ncbi:hypothetical protein H072_11230 [Dactylellina haptotyla CBS 200.50]|uniref:Uncharacterized protein n=1 Tax=Dactylellina haptotyla (strain CBS 200.50) TaxID=1284197 RepID=S8BJK0_DACHA|nr:hypothetical protein H072_11230 [Dactylellina haptotyla CBS 200.50]